ncbi:hypothetical protein ST47_g2978 [Ascochyta rabiei]|uniref:Rhodopsin domain-containing protein n=1 Tax=Didymella rabiei TaxID=5454 RepID=A0A163IVH0_DIDRA|nr:hypothetical protein ST47_g2978 [Ascochyta rabiei]
MDQLSSIIGEMLKAYPDPQGARPVANYPATMYGVTITFHVDSSTPERTEHELTVTDAELDSSRLPSSHTPQSGIKYGLGQHLVYMMNLLPTMMKYLYVTNAAYHTTTALIKVSLLLQYLRLFRQGIIRYICIILLIVVASWGIAFSFLVWFPCLPVSGFWDRKASSKCYGFGYRTADEARMTLFIFAGTNMFFDIVIFMIPLTEYFRPGLRRKQILAMTGLFIMGSLVVLMAILRLWSTFKHSADAIKSFDFTWWYPEVLIISCLEVDFAIICASMPIFWPTVVANFNAIFVTKEVHITHQDRFQDFEMGRPTSLKSTASQEGLTKLPSGEQKSYYYNDFDTDAGTGKSLALTLTPAISEQFVTSSWVKRPCADGSLLDHDRGPALTSQVRLSSHRHAILRSRTSCATTKKQEVAFGILIGAFEDENKQRCLSTIRLRSPASNSRALNAPPDLRHVQVQKPPRRAIHVAT